MRGISRARIEEYGVHVDTGEVHTECSTTADACAAPEFYWTLGVIGGG